MTREQQVARHIAAHGSITAAEFALAAGISKETASAQLNEFAKKGVIALGTRHTRGQPSVYVAAENPVPPSAFPANGPRAPGFGQARCQTGRCGNQEVEGLEHCILHVPDEYLDEAEEITGIRRCRKRFGQPDACRMYAVAGTEPPMCGEHGANLGSGNRKQATRTVFEERAAARLAEILAGDGEKLIHPEGIADPLTELLNLAAEIKAGKEILKFVVAHLYSQERIRYAHSKVGEQLRMEIILYERSLERYGHILIQISKLKIEDRLAGVREQTAAMLERALDAALEASGVGIDGKEAAREQFRRHLKVVA